MFDNDHPLRLATGNHEAGSGKGCAMNVISWENGDTVITDLPACSDPMLARIVQHVNDTICTHAGARLLCPSCSEKVLDLAHRTVGTGGILTGTALHVVWVKVACELARSVAHLNRNPRVMAAIVAAEQWANNPNVAAAAAAANAANAAAYAAYAANAAAANAAYAAYAAVSRLDVAHTAIDIFQRLTGHTDQPVEPPVVHNAIERMLVAHV